MREQVKADWRTLSAGRALDRVVAERLGWKMVIRTEDDIDEWWVVRGEIEAELLGKVGDFDSDDALWVQAFTTYECANDSALPHYSTDASAALALLQGIGLPWMLAEEPDTPFIRAFIGERNDDPERMYYHAATGAANTPALAIVRAWLAWKDEQ